MNEVKAKKFLGQHFLTDESIARRIVDSLSGRTSHVVEIGPGMGVLTKYLIESSTGSRLFIYMSIIRNWMLLRVIS